MRFDLKSKTKYFFIICKKIFFYFFEIDAVTKAGSLAYASLISIVPIMVLSASFFIAFPSFAVYFESLHKFLFKHLVPSSADTVQRYVEMFSKNATNLSAVSLIFFLFTAVLLIFSMESAFNSIWRARTRRKGLPAFLMYWAILTLLPPIAGLVFAGTIFLSSIPYLTFFIKSLAIFIPFILSWFGFLFLYMLLPNCKVYFRHAAIGALVAALLFEAMKSLFHFYATHFSFEAVYGVVSIIPVFLLWLYLAWLVVILGAVISYIVHLKDK